MKILCALGFWTKKAEWVKAVSCLKGKVELKRIGKKQEMGEQQRQHQQPVGQIHQSRAIGSFLFVKE